jgi:hypothetical protein
MSETPGVAESLPDPVLGKLDLLAGQLGDVVTELRALSDREERTSRREKRTRRLALGLAISFGFDVVLTVVVSVLTSLALSQNATLHASQLSACALTNQTRASERVLWSYLFTLTKSPRTAEETKFLGFVDKTFAAEDCSALYK